MEEIDLLTSDGSFVVTALVPPFKTYPEILLWGSRAFQLQTVTKEGERTSYREVFAAVVVETKP